MHPAFSVIIFTTVSGAGFGLLCWLGLYAIAGLLPADRLFAFVSLATGFGAVGFGLLSSTFHLGHPERAWRAFSQWRSSWLSREGVVSMATFLPGAVFATGWIWLGHSDGLFAWSGVLMSALAVLAVVCTAGIYNSLKPIPAWNNGWVMPNYVALSAMSGMMLFAALAGLFGHATGRIYASTLILAAAAFLLKLGYWHFIDTMPARSTPESATGLGTLGKVRLFEAPHTSENYLLKEMGYRVARKHARKLRAISLALAFILPVLLFAFACKIGGSPATFLSVAAFCLSMAGLLTERWLFFAEAKHAVTLYYGRRLDATAH